MIIGAIVFGALAVAALVGIALLMHRSIDADAAWIERETPDQVWSHRVRRNYMQGG